MLPKDFFNFFNFFHVMYTVLLKHVVVCNNKIYGS